jgi:hypothetical protein
MPSPEMHSVVALLEDMPNERIVRDQVGRSSRLVRLAFYEVEVSDSEGKT